MYIRSIFSNPIGGRPRTPLRIERLDRSQRRSPRGDRFDLGKKPITSRLALLGGVLKFRKARLQRKAPVNLGCLHYPAAPQRMEGVAADKSVFP
jgi:hypothetical protein